MAVNTGSSASLYLATATTAITDEATTSLGGNAYRITSASRRVLDPRVSIVVEENNVTANQPYTVNLFTGTVQFETLPTTPITVTGSYLTLVEVATCTGITVNPGYQFAEYVAIGTDHRKRVATVADFSGSIDLVEWDSALDGYVVGTSTPVILKLEIDSTNALYGWVLLTNSSVSISPDALTSTNISFEGVNLGSNQTAHGLYII